MKSALAGNMGFGHHREGKGDPSVYVYVRAKVCCTVVEYATHVLLLVCRLVGIGWVVCLVGCAVSGIPEKAMLYVL